MSSRQQKNETTDAKRVKREGGRSVYSMLRKDILTLALKPGSPLDETSLAERFGLSRSPVREALSRLAGEGLVTILSNRSTLVAAFDIENFPRYIDALDLMQRAVTRLAAQLRNEQDIERLRASNQRYVEAVNSGSYHVMSETNKDFHIEVAKAGKNTYLASYYERLLNEGQRLLHLHFDYLIEHADKSALGQEHDEIIAAIVNQDPELADKVAHEHTMLFRQRFLQYLQQNLTRNMSVA